MDKETAPQINRADGVEGCLPTANDSLESYSCRSSDMEADLETCRVCQCAESDKRGDAALEFLGLTPPVQEAHKGNGVLKLDNKLIMKHAERDVSVKKNVRESHFMELVSPDGEVLICDADVEMGSCDYQDALTELGCMCKNDLALVHYACALKWFVNHGSTVCEICGHEAKNIRAVDYRKVLASLKEYEALRERTASGEPYPAQFSSSTGVDPDAVAAIRRQRLSEISLWFSPHNNNNNHVALSQASEQPSSNVTEEVFPAENPATRWAVEGTGILLATENCPKWSSFSSWRHLCSYSGRILSLFCAYQNQVWACTLLGDFVCVLVSCLWYLGFPDTWDTLNMVSVYGT